MYLYRTPNKHIDPSIVLLILSISLSLVLYSTPLLAQDEQKGKEVFSRKQLEVFNARTLLELFNALPGISADGSGIRIQGSTANSVVVFIDGRRITDPSTKSTSVSGYWASQIKQIEVIKGAGAAIYGDDTAGGVILIATIKEKRGISGTFEAFTDTYQRSQIKTRMVQRKESSAIGGTLLLTYYDQPKEYTDLKSVALKNLFADKILDSGAKWTTCLDGFYGEYQLPGLTYAPTPHAELKGYDWNLTTIIVFH